MTEKLPIPDETIRLCLQENYQLIARTLDFLPLGNDTTAWVYRVVGEDNMPYFLKIKPTPLYEASCYMPRTLKEQGIQEVLAPLPTRFNQLWTHLGNWVVSLYPWIEGETGWKRGMKNQNWKELGKILKQIHNSPLSPELALGVKKETFNAREWHRVKELDAQLPHLQSQNDIESALIASWMLNRPVIRRIMFQMEKLAQLLRIKSGRHVICHADLHPGNILIDSSDKLFLIDWDDVMVAPKERDFLFVNEGEQPETAPFFQGYGKVEIDWIALTYYRCERVVQDLAEYSRVALKVDLNEETRMDSVRGFGKIFEPEGEVESAIATIKRLPSDLRIRSE